MQLKVLQIWRLVLGGLRIFPFVRHQYQMVSGYAIVSLHVFLTMVHMRKSDDFLHKIIFPLLEIQTTCDVFSKLNKKEVIDTTPFMVLYVSCFIM